MSYSINLEKFQKRSNTLLEKDEVYPVFYTLVETTKLRPKELGLEKPKINVEAIGKYRSEEKLSQRDFAKECNLNQSTISKIENKKWNPETKTIHKILKNTELSKEELGLSEFAWEFEDLSKIAKESIEGFLIGDGYIENKKNRNKRFSLTSVDARYSGYCQQELGKYGIFGGISFRHEPEFTYSRFISSALDLWNDFFEKWYVYDPGHPSSGKKRFRRRIPEDFEMREKIGLHFYMGKGSLMKSNGAFFARFTTGVFPENEVEIIMDSLSDKGFNLTNKWKHKEYEEKEDRGYDFAISTTKSNRDFFEFIGDCPSIARDAITDRKGNRRIEDKWP